MTVFCLLPQNQVRGELGAFALKCIHHSKMEYLSLCRAVAFVKRCKFGSAYFFLSSGKRKSHRFYSAANLTSDEDFIYSFPVISMTPIM